MRIILILFVCVFLANCSQIMSLLSSTTGKGVNVVAPIGNKFYAGNTQDNKGNEGQIAQDSIQNISGNSCNVINHKTPFVVWMNYWFMAALAFIGWSCPYTPQIIVRNMWRWLVRKRRKK